MKLMKLCLLLVGLLAASVVQANDDWTTQTKVKAGFKVAPRWSVSGDVEMRTKNDLEDMDRWSAGLGVSYRLASFAKLEGGYETHYRNLGQSEWKFRHRYYVGATLDYKWSDFKFSLRERIQQTIYRGDTQSRLRSRLKISYHPAEVFVAPYASVELYQSLDDASFWHANRMRYRGGLDFAFSKTIGLDAFYCYQHQASVGKNIIGLELKFSF